MQYSTLNQTYRILDNSDLSGRTTAAAPAPIRIHAVRVADSQVMCGYQEKPGDERKPSRDWATVHPAEQPCGDCTRQIAES